MLACLRGREAEAVSLVEATIAGATAGGQGLTVGYANWVAAILYNSLGQYEQALAAATQSSQDAAMYVSLWALPELIEAAVRSGNAGLAAGPMARLAESTQAGDTVVSSEAVPPGRGQARELGAAQPSSAPIADQGHPGAGQGLRPGI